MILVPSTGSIRTIPPFNKAQLAFTGPERRQYKMASSRNLDHRRDETKRRRRPIRAAVRLRFRLRHPSIIRHTNHQIILSKADRTQHQLQSVTISNFTPLRVSPNRNRQRCHDRHLHARRPRQQVSQQAVLIWRCAHNVATRSTMLSETSHSVAHIGYLISTPAKPRPLYRFCNMEISGQTRPK